MSHTGRGLAEGAGAALLCSQRPAHRRHQQHREGFVQGAGRVACRVPSCAGSSGGYISGGSGSRQCCYCHSYTTGQQTLVTRVSDLQHCRARKAVEVPL